MSFLQHHLTKTNLNPEFHAFYTHFHHSSGSLASQFSGMSQPNGVGLSTTLIIHRLTHITLLHSSLSLHQSSLLLSSILHSLLLAEPRESQGRILHAKALLDTGAPNSALHLVKQVALTTGDLRLAEVGARACDKLGRNREGLDLMVGARQRWEEKSRQRGAVQEPGQLASSSSFSLFGL